MTLHQFKLVAENGTYQGEFFENLCQSTYKQYAHTGINLEVCYNVCKKVYKSFDKEGMIYTDKIIDKVLHEMNVILDQLNILKDVIDIIDEKNKENLSKGISEKTEKFNWGKILKENTVVNCVTEEQARSLLKEAHEKGLKWCRGNSYLEKNHWSLCKENTCYDLLDGSFDSIDYCKENYTILTYVEVLLSEKENKEQPKIEKKGR